MKLKLIIVFLSASFDFYAQTTFKQDFHLSSRFYGLVELQDNDYIFMPNMFCRMNQIGNIQDQHYYDATGSFFLMNSIEKKAMKTLLWQVTL